MEKTRKGYQLTPKAYRIFQSKLLEQIFSQLQASRSGRHQGPIVGEGAVELPSTKPYEFGDSVANMDIPASFTNAVLRRVSERPAEEYRRFREAGCDRERDTAEHRHPEQHQQHAARAETVECSAERQLGGGEAEKVGARQQTEVGRLQTQFGTERRCKRRGDPAHQRREEIGEGKAGEHPHRHAGGHRRCVGLDQDGRDRDEKKASSACASRRSPITVAW